LRFQRKLRNVQANVTYVPTAADRHSIAIVKAFSYRGLDRLFSNRYHFEGALPADAAHWATLADNIVAGEKAIYGPGVTIVEAIGNDHTSATNKNLNGDAVFTKTYALAGTGSFGAGTVLCPGDCAALIRYATPARSVRNHPVYLMNYYHGVYRDGSSADNVDADQVTAMETYADHWLSGFTDGTTPRERCGPHGAVATARRVDPLIRHRDFPA
jgi:hypothetical protein